VDAPYHEHAFVLLDLTYSLGHQPVNRRGNLTRLQRASKGSGQSTGRRGDNIVERGGMRRKGIRRNLIMLGDCAMDAEDHRRRLRGQVSAAHGTSLALDAHFRSIDYVSHFATIAP
jgi:hypothetical protein